MAATQSIPPFPLDVDRDRFGDWLSGFVDGEGCFLLTMKKNTGWRQAQTTPRATFTISLRADDEAILRQIQSFWQCGRDLFSLIQMKAGFPAWRYDVGNWEDLATIVIPHFDRYPLRAKKARDFTIWRQAVLMGAEVSKRSRLPRPGQRGYRSKWQPVERERFAALHDALREGRRFAQA